MTTYITKLHKARLRRLLMNCGYISQKSGVKAAMNIETYGGYRIIGEYNCLIADDHFDQSMETVTCFVGEWKDDD